MDLKNPSKCSKEELSLFCMQYGIDIEGLQHNELVALVMSLQDVPQEDIEISDMVKRMNDNNVTSSSSALNTYNSLSNSINSNYSSNTTINAAPTEDLYYQSSSYTSDTTGPLVEQFCEITGCTVPSDATGYLEAFGNDLNGAVAAYMENTYHHSTTGTAGSGVADSAHVPQAPLINSSSSSYNMQPPRVPLGTRYIRHDRDLSTDEDEMDYDYDFDSRTEGIRGGRGGDGAVARNAVEYDEDGIRKPDPIMQGQRLIGGSRYSSMSSTSDDMDTDNDPLGRAEHPSVDWMFPPPHHIIFPGSLQAAKRAAQRDKKWILVNVQDSQQFQSHQLNRDTWKNDTVIELLRGNFIFWQRGDTSNDGKNFVRMYNLRSDDLPLIAIIDSRTGAKLTSHTGYIKEDTLVLMLVEFLEQNKLDRLTAPVVRNAGSRSSSIDITEKKAPPAASGSAVISSSSTASSSKISSSSASSNSNGGSNDKAVVSTQSLPQQPSAALKVGSSIVKKQSKYSLDDLTVEPPEGGDTIKIALKLVNGTTIRRRFNKHDSIKCLYALCISNISDANERDFDVITTVPMRNLSSHMESTLHDEALGGCQVVMRYCA